MKNITRNDINLVINVNASKLEEDVKRATNDDSIKYDIATDLFVNKEGFVKMSYVCEKLAEYYDVLEISFVSTNDGEYYEMGIKPMPYQSFFYAFCADPELPFQNGWVEIKAISAYDATACFQSHYPNRANGCISCAFYYTESQWEEAKAKNVAHGDENICHAIFITENAQMAKEKAMKESKANIVALLTTDEKYNIYRDIEHNYRLEDAEKAFLDYFGLGEGTTKENFARNKESFFRQFGFSAGAALTAGNEHYMLENIVNIFVDNADCNADENSTWRTSIYTAIHEL